MYAGWTYEIDAEAEVRYTNQDPTNWLVDHRWTFDNHPYISRIGRGGVRDFYTDFRFSKVLEFEDEGTEHQIDVTCSVRDVRYPQLNFRLEDSDIVKFLIGGIDFNPADLICINLQDVVMFEGSNEFAMYYTVGQGYIAGGFEVKVYPDAGTVGKKVYDLVKGKTSSTYKTTAFAYEYGDIKVVCDVDATKYRNEKVNGGNQTFFVQQKGWVHEKSGKTAVIFDSSLDSGLLDPYDASTPSGIRDSLNKCLGALGSDWDIFNHKDISSAQASSDPVWDNYTLFIYVDRSMAGRKLFTLQHVQQRVLDGNAGLIVWGEGQNARVISENVTGVVYNQTTEFAEQEADPNWGAVTHAINTGVDIDADRKMLFGYEGIDQSGDFSVVSKWQDFQADEDMTQIQEIRFKKNNNALDEPHRRKWWVEIVDSKGVSPNCGAHKASVTFIDDEIQRDTDVDSISLVHTHTIGDEIMRESFIFKPNTWYKWDNQRYIDLSADGFIYGLTYGHCGAARIVKGIIKVRNTSSGMGTLVGNVFNQNFALNDGEVLELNASKWRNEDTVDPSSSGSTFGFLTIEPTEGHTWEVEFMYEDSAPCPGEPTMPVYCVGDYSIRTQYVEDIEYYKDITADCTNFEAEILVNPCGLERYVPVRITLRNDDNEDADIRIETRDGTFHTERLYAHGTLDVTISCKYPDEGSLFAPPDDHAWIVKINANAMVADVVPNFTGTIEVQDTSGCGKAGANISCPTAYLPSGDIGYNWYIGDVIDGQWYQMDNQDDICAQIYEGFNIYAANLNLPWAERNDYRYEIQIVFTARNNGEYQYITQGRYSGDADSTIWVSNNVPETFNHTYYLMNADFGTGGQDNFTERHALSFRALDPTARLNFLWRIRFTRQKKVNGVWEDAPRKPWEGYTKKRKVGSYPAHVRYPNYPIGMASAPNADRDYNIIYYSFFMNSGAPSVGEILLRLKVSAKKNGLKSVSVFKYLPDESSVAAATKDVAQMEHDLYTGMASFEIAIAISREHLDLAMQYDKNGWVGRYLYIAAYPTSVYQFVTDFKVEVIGLDYTHIPEDVPADKTPAVDFSGFMAQFPYDTPYRTSAITVPNSYDNEYQTSAQVAGFYKSRVHVYPKAGDTALLTTMSINVYAYDFRTLIGVIAYDHSDNVISQKVIRNNNTFQSLGVRCDLVKYIDIYSLDGTAFSEGEHSGSLSVKIKG